MDGAPHTQEPIQQAARSEMAENLSKRLEMVRQDLDHLRAETAAAEGVEAALTAAMNTLDDYKVHGKVAPEAVELKRR